MNQDSFRFTTQFNLILSHQSRRVIVKSRHLTVITLPSQALLAITVCPDAFSCPFCVISPHCSHTVEHEIASMKLIDLFDFFRVPVV